MARDAELDRLGRERDRAKEAKDLAKHELDKAWDELQMLQRRHSARIDALKDEHDRLHAEVEAANKEAARQYHWRDHDKVRYWKEKAQQHRSMMPDLVEERRRLVAEIQRARVAHKDWRDKYRPRKDEFERARDRFQHHLDQLKAENEYQRQKRLDEFPKSGSSRVREAAPDYLARTKRESGSAEQGSGWTGEIRLEGQDAQRPTGGREARWQNQEDLRQPEKRKSKDARHTAKRKEIGKAVMSLFWTSLWLAAFSIGTVTLWRYGMSQYDPNASASWGEAGRIVGAVVVALGTLVLAVVWLGRFFGFLAALVSRK